MRTDRRTDGRDEANSHLSQFFERAKKVCSVSVLLQYKS